MISTRRLMQSYWAVVGLVLVLLAWWAVFFVRQGDYLTTRIAASGQVLTAGEEAAVRAAASDTLRMFLAEGLFLVLLLLGGMLLVVRSMQRELMAHRQHKDFLSAVTHELRSPIASASLYVESILLGRAEGAKATRYLHSVKQDLERLRQQVDGLLAAARVHQAHPQLQPQELELCAHVRNTVARLEQAGLPEGTRLEFEGKQELLARTDPQAVTAIVENLVSNAIKYGGEPAHVVVRVDRLDAQAELSVRDFGPGLRGADAQSIFEPFVRGVVHEQRMRPGVGLGLFMVAELARALGGKALADDQPQGGGLRIRVRFPLSPQGVRA